MTSKIHSCTLNGLDCYVVEVQADISNGLSSFTIVGLGDTSVQESRERVRSGIKNSGAHYPQTKKTINLAPAQIRKQGSLFDLPIALSLLIADQQIKPDRFRDSVIIGELSLSGKLKPINGILAITEHARCSGFKNIFLPRRNAEEAGFISGINIYPVTDLKQLIAFANGQDQLPLYESPPRSHTPITTPPLTFSKIIGHDTAKRALIIAAAGGHNVLLSGSPGCGKTLLCRSFKALLPTMSEQEILETTKNYSITGLLDQKDPLIRDRPFREVHHTASIPSIIGGGTNPTPGEISLAHNGVLFFDEITEFPKSLLETLRQPLEDQTITINRTQYSAVFPADFIFLATMNPCPCGYYGDNKIRCICSDSQKKAFNKKLSGPILDRFDLFLKIEKSDMNKIFNKNSNDQSDQIIRQIETARTLQNDRFKNSNVKRNSSMSFQDITKFCHLNKTAIKIIKQASENLNLSNRGYLKTIKIARTIADLSGNSEISKNDILEAVQYRSR